MQEVKSIWNRSLLGKVAIGVGALFLCCICGAVFTALLPDSDQHTAQVAESPVPTVPDITVKIATPTLAPIPSDTPIPSPTVPAFQVYAVGDVIELDGSTIVLNSATFVSDQLHANFTVENTGAEEITISSILLFDARDGNGSDLEREIFDCESGGLDGEVLPTDKLRGNICWEGIQALPVKIYYQYQLFADNSTIVWEIKQ